MKLLKDMNKEELIKEFKRIANTLKSNNLNNDNRFLLEVRASNIERKLYRKFNFDIRNYIKKSY